VGGDWPTGIWLHGADRSDSFRARARPRGKSASSLDQLRTNAAFGLHLATSSVPIFRWHDLRYERWLSHPNRSDAQRRTVPLPAREMDVVTLAVGVRAHSVRGAVSFHPGISLMRGFDGEGSPRVAHVTNNGRRARPSGWF